MTRQPISAASFVAWRKHYRLGQAEIAQLFAEQGYFIGQTGISAWTRRGVPARAVQAFAKVAAIVGQRDTPQLTELPKAS